MGKEALFFDYGGTLVRNTPGQDPLSFRASVLENLGVQVPKEKLRQESEALDRELLPQIYTYLGRTKEFWQRYDRQLLDRLHVTERRDVVAQQLGRAFEDMARFELYPETLEVLADLKFRGYTLGIISNHHEGILPVLQHLGLNAYFDSVTFSQEAGAEKPDARVFNLALRRAGCKPAQAVHVGDSWRADYQGAAALGLRAIWLNREGGPAPAPCESVRDLREYVRRL